MKRTVAQRVGLRPAVLPFIAHSLLLIRISYL